jgi:hypothetical protein
MKKMHFDVVIQAAPERVWDAVVGEREYQEWTRPFSESSRYEGGWNRGDKIRFLATNDKGETEGMVSEIAESRKPSFISIRHLGFVHGNAEDTTSAAVKAWAPAYENYSITATPEGTRFAVEIDTEDQWVSMFDETWPKALAALKGVAERTRPR